MPNESPQNYFKKYWSNCLEYKKHFVSLHQIKEVKRITNKLNNSLMVSNYSQNWNYKEITLFSFAEFKQRCMVLFDVYFGNESFTYISNSHYYCGDGSHTFTIYTKDMDNELFTITQNDFCGDLYFSVYIGDQTFKPYDKENEYHFQSLTGAINFIIANI